MFERYSIGTSSSQIADRFSIETSERFKPKYNAAPTQLLPVILSGENAKGLSWFYWGRSPEFAHNRNLSEKIINIASETLRERPVLKKALIKHRCIVPADGFYAWKKVGKKTAIPYRFVLGNQSIFSFAAIWEEFENQEGETEHTFSIITTQANHVVKTVHERMPVILDAKTEQIWLSENSTENELMKLLVPYQDGQLNLYTVSPKINDPKIDSPSLITAAPPADQHGNLTLFD